MFSLRRQWRQLALLVPALHLHCAALLLLLLLLLHVTPTAAAALMILCPAPGKHGPHAVSATVCREPADHLQGTTPASVNHN